MSDAKKCKHCNSPLHHHRSDAKFCKPACRSAHWRLQQQKEVRVKIHFTVAQLSDIADDAAALGIKVNELIARRAWQPASNSNRWKAL